MSILGSWNTLVSAGIGVACLLVSACSSQRNVEPAERTRRDAFSLDGFPADMRATRERLQTQNPPKLEVFTAPAIRPPALFGLTKPEILAAFEQNSANAVRLNPQTVSALNSERLPGFRAGHIHELRGDVVREYSIADYAKEVAAELGPIPSFSVFEQGILIPTTLDDIEVPAGRHTAAGFCDRPALLGLGEDGQCVPYSRIGRLPGTNPTTGAPDARIQWVFIARRYKIRSDPMNPIFEDVAIIGHNRTTGYTAFFQMLDSENGKDATRVPSPMEPASQTPAGTLTAEQFWLPPARTAAIGCNRCHDSDPFVHTPYVNQVRITSGAGAGETIVPTDPAGRYRFVGSQAFTAWVAPEHFDPEGNACVACHRIGTQASSESFAKWATGTASTPQLSSAYRSFPNSHWMPPQDAESMTQAEWDAVYRQSVQQLLSCSQNSGQASCRRQTLQ